MTTKIEPTQADIDAATTTVKQLRTAAERQRVNRGCYLDYGRPDPWLIEAANLIESLKDDLRLAEARGRAEGYEQAIRDAVDATHGASIGMRSSDSVQAASWMLCTGFVAEQILKLLENRE